MSTILIDKATMMEEVRKLISEGLTVELTAKGYSMNPFIMHLRDVIVLGPWKDEDIRKGAVVLVKDTKGHYVIHRIINREGCHITLMGDGNVGLKETATLDNVIGIMHSITRKNRIYSSKSLIWKTYSWIWMTLRPVRLYPLVLWRKLNPQPPLSSPSK